MGEGIRPKVGPKKKLLELWWKVLFSRYDCEFIWEVDQDFSICTRSSGSIFRSCDGICPLFKPREMEGGRQLSRTSSQETELSRSQIYKVWLNVLFRREDCRFFHQGMFLSCTNGLVSNFACTGICDRFEPKEARQCTGQENPNLVSGNSGKRYLER